jgi:hypothetical protein
VKDAKEPLDAAAVEERFPGLPERLSRSPGIGFVLARSANGNGPLCWWQGQRCELSPTQPGPFAGREDAALVVEGIENLMKMRSAGDLVIYGTALPTDTCPSSAGTAPMPGREPARCIPSSYARQR